MDVTTPAPGDLADHLAALRRGWLVLACAALLGLIAAGVVTTLLPHRYRATTAVLVLPTGAQDANAAGGRTKESINLDTEAQLVRSTAVAARARTLLHVTTPPAQLAGAVDVSVPPNSTVLQIAYSATDPAAARAGSHAFATAYLANRADSAQAATNATVRALREQANRVNAELRSTTGKLANAEPNSSTHALLDAQRRNLTGQLGTLGNRINDATTRATSAGRIITDAAAPTRPTSPSVPVNLAAGLLVGLFAGAVAALAAARFGRRVATAADLTRRTGVPVLSDVPAGPAAARCLGRLRNELSAGDGGPAVLAVVGAGGSGAAVAARLAAAFARAGQDTVLIAAAGDGCPPVPDRPGLTDVLAGTIGLPTALHPADGEPGLAVLPAGSPTGALPIPAVGAVLDRLRDQRTTVLLATPDAADGPEAQALAALADAAILAVPRRTARYAAVRDAAEQLHRVGTTLLGAVLTAPTGIDTETGAHRAPAANEVEGAADEPEGAPVGASARA
ncbi:Wzz/FepE/Etk N-terminal domain-containing protein [Actinocatenispora sera]|uniref:Wzz/FepE/Etk N-terminal domain-containing protein n=1 Tax=Actinocatenispora sera TaxID=390989 RepID=UPI0033C2A5DA